MPLLLKKAGLFGEVFGCWLIDEPEGFFLEKLELADGELVELSSIKHSRRRLEWLAGRLALHQISGSGQRAEISKTATGKPFWPTAPGRFFSMSHSAGRVAAAMVSDEPCGIDIQIFTEKTRRLAPRFLGEKELAENEPTDDFFQKAWGAKESMFKAWGRGGVDFRRQLFIENLGDGRADGRLEMPLGPLRFDLIFEKMEVGGDPFMLARAVEKGGRA